MICPHPASFKHYLLAPHNSANKEILIFVFLFFFSTAVSNLTTTRVVAVVVMRMEQANVLI
jgi:hypothetical protein